MKKLLIWMRGFGVTLWADNVKKKKKSKTRNSQALLAGVYLLFIGNKPALQYLSIIKFCSLMISDWVENSNPLFTRSPSYVLSMPLHCTYGIVLSHLEPNRITAENSLQKSLVKKKKKRRKRERLTKDMRRVAVFISSKVFKVIAKF